MISNYLSLKDDFESICVMIQREYAQAQPGLLVSAKYVNFPVRHYICKN